MKALLLAVLVVGQLSTTEADTCANCVTAFEDNIDTGDDDAKCGVIKTLLTCLVDATACPIAADEAAAIKTKYEALGTCDLSEACTCQYNYFSTDLTSDICTPTMAYFHCLTGKTEVGCNGAATVKVLATAAEGAIPDSCSAKTDTCDCQITYTKADISDATKKCTAVTAYYNCLTGKTALACDGSEKVKDLADAIFTEIPDPCAAKTDTCDCQITLTRADFETEANKCTAITEYYDCLTGKTAAACVGTGSVETLANAIFSAIPTTCAAKTDTCDCQIAYTRADAADDAKKCTAAKDLVSCLVGKNNVGCESSSTVITLATAAKVITDTDDCVTSDVCDCEIAYAVADISNNDKRCTETKTLTSCIQTSINDGCGASTTKTDVGTAAQDAFTALTAGVCALTSTCQCQVDFNKADVTPSNKCTAGTALDTCLTGISTTTEVGCNGTVTAAELTTDMKTRVKDVLCSAAGLELKSSILISLLMLMISALFVSP